MRVSTLAACTLLALAALVPAATADHHEDPCDDPHCGPPQEPCEPACVPFLGLVSEILGPPGSDPCRPMCLGP